MCFAVSLDDPVYATIRFSHDPSLELPLPLGSGAQASAVELQLLFLEEARRFVSNGGCEGGVPQAGEILSLWEDTLVKLQSKDFAALGGRLDWVLKLSILLRALEQHPELDWDSPEIKHLDTAKREVLQIRRLKQDR